MVNMRSALVSSALAASATAHGVLRSVEGANGVSMPGLCVLDGTPRNCVVNACGAQADTGICRDNEMVSGQYGPLGWTQGNGACKPESVVNEFFGTGPAPQYQGGRASTGAEDDLSGLAKLQSQRREEHKQYVRQVSGGFWNLPVIGTLGLGGKRTEYPTENIVQTMAGQGKEKGLPTADDNGEVSVIYRQINQDGAGPLTAAIDPSSGGTDYKAFKSAQMTKNAPGSGFLGLSLSTNMDYEVKVKMPEGMVCEGKIGEVENVCVVRIRNQAPAGPFGGAAAFTQSSASRKRAVAFNLKKRQEQENRTAFRLKTRFEAEADLN